MLNVSFALQLANNFLGPLKWMKNYSRKGETYFFWKKATYIPSRLSSWFPTWIIKGMRDARKTKFKAFD